MCLLVIGATGLVGQNVVEHAQAEGHTVRGTSREGGAADIQLDKTDDAAVRKVVAGSDPDAIVDTAAFHAVDDCETERDRAWGVNAAGTRNVAAAANATGAHLVYLSTDYVFRGEPMEAPYAEADPVCPVNYYGRTKLAGEQAALIAEEATVLRPSVIYGLASDNFVTWALGELEANNEIGIVDDQVSTPTYAPDLAAACVGVLEAGLTGHYHSTGPDSVSRFEFTRTLAEVYGHDPDLVEPITTDELGQEAPRPADSSLDSSRLTDTLDVEFRGLRRAFAHMRDAGGH